MIDRSDYISLIEAALFEDLADRGDITTKATVPKATRMTGDLVARSEGLIAGLGVAADVFAVVDESVLFARMTTDGEKVAKSQVIARVEGPARSILTAERTALNLLARMSGVATATNRFVQAVAGTNTQISDTRKTMPGLRLLDKYSVVAGGGVNHRMGLYDAVMIKDNHLVAGLEMEDAVRAARAEVGPDMVITVEVENLDQLRRVVGTDADRVLLDNMSLGMLTEAVGIVEGRMVTEASGGITLHNVRDVALTGVDVISVGWITHSAPQLDIALDFHSG